MVVKWETLKGRAKKALDKNQSFLDASAVAALEALQGTAHFSGWRGTSAELRQEVLEYVRRWDVRCAMKLVKAFPFILPEKYHDQIPVGKINDNGDWVLIFN